MAGCRSRRSGGRDGGSVAGDIRVARELWQRSVFADRGDLDPAERRASGSVRRVRSQNGGQDTYLGIYFWNNGNPQLRLYKRTGRQLDPARQHLRLRPAARRHPAHAERGRLHDLLRRKTGSNGSPRPTPP